MTTLKKYEFTISYFKPYVPPRCRKPRYEETEETISLRVRCVTRDEVRTAFRLADYGHTERHQHEIILFRGQLYIRAWRHLTREERNEGRKGYAPLEADSFTDYNFCPHDLHALGDETRENVIRNLRAKAKRYLLLDGYVWERCGEPRFVIMTFGLGHNHGGSGLFVEESYNPNIHRDRYFSALERDKAVAEFNRIAAARGDTNDIGRYDNKKLIEVLIPQYVKLDPGKEHGKGNSFINALDCITRCADNVAEAGLLAAALTAAHIAE